MSQTRQPQHIRQMDIAAEIARATTSILDLPELLNTSVTLLQENFGFYYIGIFLVDEDGKWAVLKAGSGQTGQKMLKEGYRLELGTESLIGQCIINGESRVIQDTKKAETHVNNPLLPESRSEAVLPLVARDTVIGTMVIQSNQVDTFSTEDLRLLQTISNQLGIAIENARLFEEANRSQHVAEDLLHETIALQQLSQALSGTLQQNEILDIFFQTCTKVMGFDFVIFSLVDKKQQRVKAIAGVGITADHLKRADHSLDSKDIMVDIIDTGATEIIVGWDDRFDPNNFEAENMSDWGQRVFTPIKLRNENIGLVEVGYNKNTETVIEDAQIRLLRAFIDQTALALENARRHEASQRAIRREALIKEITTKVRASTNLDTILQTTVREIGDAIGGQRTYIHLVSPPNGQD